MKQTHENVVRVTVAGAAELRRRAEASGKTMGVVLEELLALDGVLAGTVEVRAVKPKKAAPVPAEQSSPPAVTVVGEESSEPFLDALKAAAHSVRCPHCHCSAIMHAKGVMEDRCERHPACRWKPAE